MRKQKKKNMQQESPGNVRGFLPYIHEKIISGKNIKIKIRGISGRKSIYWL